MSESVTIIQEALNAIAKDGSVSLAVIVARSGSAPRGVGAMLLLRHDGSFCGTVGGGSLELQIMNQLRIVQQDGVAAIHPFQLLPEQDGMPCGGSIKVLLAKLTGNAAAVFATAAGSLTDGNGCKLLVGLDDNDQACWSVDEPLRNVDIAYSIPLQPVPMLLICGAGHIAQALAPMALTAGFKVMVLDDRADLLSVDRFSAAVETINISGFNGCLACKQITLATYILIATYGHQHDRAVLEQALATDAGYIGMVGSRRKREELFAELRTTGVVDTELSRVRCPVGLAIGAETPAEIAVSILAEMIAVQRGRG